MPPAISLVLPVYNGRAYLLEALESVSRQTLNDFECLVVDDGSTDGSVELAERFLKQSNDSRFRIIRNSHAGIVTALNTGLAQASAPLLGRMDADDVANPERLALQCRAMDEHPDWVASGGGALAVDPRNRPLFQVVPPEEHEAILDLLRKGKGSAIIHPTAVFRTDALRQLGGYRETYRHIEDLDVYWRMAKVGRLGNVTDVLLRYRQHPQSANVKYADRQRELTQRWLDEVAKVEGSDVARLRFYRPGTRAELYADWASKALNSGFRATGRLYALKSLACQPLKVSRWRFLMASVLREATLPNPQTRPR